MEVVPDVTLEKRIEMEGVRGTRDKEEGEEERGRERGREGESHTCCDC